LETAYEKFVQIDTLSLKKQTTRTC